MLVKPFIYNEMKLIRNFIFPYQEIKYHNSVLHNFQYQPSIYFAVYFTSASESSDNCCNTFLARSSYYFSLKCPTHDFKVFATFILTFATGSLANAYNTGITLLHMNSPLNEFVTKATVNNGVILCK